MLYQDLHRLPEALAAGQRALAVRRAALGPNHPSVAVTLNNLSLIASESGERAAAKELVDEAVRIAENGPLRDLPNHALFLTNLAEWHRNGGDNGSLRTAVPPRTGDF